MNCSSLSFFDSRDFLRIALHTVSVFGIPIHVYGGYCILCKTPKEMCSVKVTMLNLHFWSGMTDLFFSLLVAPFILLPSMAGVPLGFLGLLNVSVPIQIYLIITVIGMTGIAILHIFENRYNKILFETSRRKTKRLIYFLVNYFLVLTFMIPTMLRIPDQKPSAQLLFQKFPCEFDLDHFFVLAVDISIPYYLVTATCAIIEAQIVFFVIRLLIHLKGSCHIQASRRTRTLQKRLFLAICIQVTIPTLLMAIPFIYILASVSLDFHNQGLTNLSICTVSLHGAISTIVMLIVHKPYREVTLRIFRTSSQSNTAVPFHVTTP